MSTLSVLFDLLVTAAVLWRQRRVRRVGFRLHLPIFLGLLGLLELLAYTGRHPLGAGATLALLGIVVAAASALAVLRAATVHLWRIEGVLPWIVRQATWATMGLWVASLACYFVLAPLVPTTGGGITGPAYLLFLAVTSGAQRAAERARVQRFALAEGPIAAESHLFTGGFRGGGPTGGTGYHPSSGTIIDVPSEILPPHPDDQP